ncbi:MAG: PilZ domain-containing protein [Sphingobium phenoxybenzoativorans]|uniref:PilZ domain-containing protein n=1 Tax=Sphingobium phenoxybenzoativorans TaxID=1592790 RepID=A0A975K9T5_9SPHN|nr:PilZ domain-containing protein [Sphingobium phenoxybenzoativorans]QUT06994.1 PilZ domain-containing protein [Sphingobium phenoxybenzoativorans]
MFVENGTSLALPTGFEANDAARLDQAGLDDAHAVRPTRVTISEPARVRIATSLIRVRTIDISSAGAKLDLCAEVDCSSILNLFTPGTIILLTITGMVEPRLCQVRWRSGSRIGVQFDTPILPKVLDCITDNADSDDRTSCILEVGSPQAPR